MEQNRDRIEQDMDRIEQGYRQMEQNRIEQNRIGRDRLLFWDIYQDELIAAVVELYILLNVKFNLLGKIKGEQTS